FYFFSYLFKPYYKTVFRICLILFVIIYCISFFYWGGQNKLISSAINRVYISSFILIFSVIWYKNQFTELEKLNPFEKMEMPNLWQSDAFYFVSGLAVYYSTTFSLFLLSSSIFNSKLYFYDFWFVNVLAILIFRIFLIIGVWKMQHDYS